MLNANIGEIEKMAEYIDKASSETEEAMLALKSLRSELSEDTEMSLTSEYVSVMESIESALTILEKNNDTLQSLKNSTANIAGNYSDNEKKNISALESVKSIAAGIGAMAKTVFSSDSFPFIDRTGDEDTELRTDKLVGLEHEDIEVTNVSGATAAFNDSYEIREIKDMEDTE